MSHITSQTSSTHHQSSICQKSRLPLCVCLVLGLLCSIGMGLGYGIFAGLITGAAGFLALALIFSFVKSTKAPSPDKIRVRCSGWYFEGPSSTPISTVVSQWLQINSTGEGGHPDWKDMRINGRQLTIDDEKKPISSFITSSNSSLEISWF